ncbi:MAG: hypothetical protein NTW71_08075, partial [Deltaproteobacteria bacterium]|nr:hypothetical protein [Deltaproteobacteria bacterium]
MKERLPDAFPERGSGNPEGIQDIFDTTLQIIKIRLQILEMPSVFISSTGDEKSRAVVFPGLFPLPLPDERSARFKDLQIEAADIGVSPDIGQKALDQGGPHHRLLFRQGIPDPDMQAPLIRFGQAELIDGIRR